KDIAGNESGLWKQDDWIGGSGQAVWNDNTKYAVDSGELDISTAGSVKLGQIIGSYEAPPVYAVSDGGVYYTDAMGVYSVLDNATWMWDGFDGTRTVKDYLKFPLSSIPTTITNANLFLNAATPGTGTHQLNHIPDYGTLDESDYYIVPLQSAVALLLPPNPNCCNKYINRDITTSVEEDRVVAKPYSSFQITGTGQITWNTSRSTYPPYLSITYDRQIYNTSGTLTSSIFDSGGAADYSTISWQAVTPDDSSVTVKVQAGKTDISDTDSDFADGANWTHWFTVSNNSELPSAINGNQFIRYRTIFDRSSDRLSTPTLSNLSINMTTASRIVLDTINPDFSANLKGFRDSSKKIEYISGNSYNDMTPYFEWDPALDSNLKGYKVYFGIDANADPRIDSDVNSPSNLAYTDNNNSALYTSTAYSVSSELESGTTYYLKVVAADDADNYSSTTAVFNYRHDSSIASSELTNLLSWTTERDFKTNAITTGETTSRYGVDISSQSGDVLLENDFNTGGGAEGDLVVDGTTAANSTDGQVHDENNPYILDGKHYFNNVTIQNGGVITHSLGAGKGTDTEGLELYITGDLTIDASSKIDVSAKGYENDSFGILRQNLAIDGGPGVGMNRVWSLSSYGLTDPSGVGAAGGSYGSQGGYGLPLTSPGYLEPSYHRNDARPLPPKPGKVYGNAVWPEAMGSAGGATIVQYQDYSGGGNGGGRVKIVSQNANIEGSIQANGQGGAASFINTYNMTGGAGGSGGAIVIVSSDLNISGILSAAGGGGGGTLAGKDGFNGVGGEGGNSDFVIEPPGVGGQPGLAGDGGSRANSGGLLINGGLSAGGAGIHDAVGSIMSGSGGGGAGRIAVHFETLDGNVANNARAAYSASPTGTAGPYAYYKKIGSGQIGSDIAGSVGLRADGKQTVEWKNIFLNATNQENVRLQIRVADTENDLDDAQYIGWDGTQSTWYDSDHTDLSNLATSRYAEILVDMQQKVGANPVLHDVSIGYTTLKLGDARSIKQLKEDGSTLIEVGGATNESKIIFEAKAIAPETSTNTRAEFEIKPIDYTFDGTEVFESNIESGGITRLDLSTNWLTDEAGIAQVANYPDAPSGYQYMKRITIRNNSTSEQLPVDFQVSAKFNHEKLAGSSKSLANGDDIRVYYYSSGNGQELDRVLDEDSNWHSKQTKIWFKSRAPIAANQSDGNYYLVYGDLSASNPPADHDAIFEYYDAFGGNSLDMTKWSLLNSPVTQVANGSLTLTFDDHNIKKGVETIGSFSPPLVLEQRFRTQTMFSNDYSSPIDAALGGAGVGLIGPVMTGVVNRHYYDSGNNIVPFKGVNEWNDYKQTVVGTTSIYQRNSSVDTRTMAENRDGVPLNLYLRGAPYWNMNNDKKVYGEWDYVRVLKYFSQKPSVKVDGEGQRPKYHWRVRLKDDEGRTSLWKNFGQNHDNKDQAATDIIFDATNPTIPGKLSVVSPTSITRPVWSWVRSADSESGLKGYYFYLGSTPGATDIINGELTDISSITPTQSLTPGTYYGFVRAVDNAGNISGSSPNTILTVVDDGTTFISPAPSNLAVVAKGLPSLDIDLNWFTPATGTVDYYKIYRSDKRITDINKWYASLIGTSTTTTYTDAMGTAGATYYYQVTAVSTNGEESAVSVLPIKEYAKVPIDGTTWTTKDDFENNAITTNTSTETDKIKIPGVNPGDDVGVGLAPAQLWQYRKPITITNSTAGALVDYQVQVDIDTQALIASGKMKTDGSDIRFFNTSDELLPYWIESGINTTSTNIWIKVDSIAASPSPTTLYMYYGNPEAVEASNGDDVFAFFDDFSGSALDSSKWTRFNSPSIVLSSGIMSLGFVDFGVTRNITSTTKVTPPLVLEEKYRLSNVGCGIGGLKTLVGSMGPGVLDKTFSTEYSHYYDGGSVALGATDQNWHTYKQSIFGTTSIYDRDGTVDTRTMANNNDGSNLNVKLEGTSSSNCYPFMTGWDFVRVRKYASTEPSVSAIGTEENLSIPANIFQSPGIISKLIIDQRSDSIVHWDKLSYNAVIPPASSVKFRTRGADNTDDLGAATWSGYLTQAQSPILTPPSKYLEIEMNLESDGTETPTLDDFSVSYQKMNPPVLSTLKQADISGNNLAPNAFVSDTSLDLLVENVKGLSTSTTAIAQFEVKEVTGDFDGQNLIDGGSATIGQTSKATINSLEGGKSYKWRARVVDDVNRTSTWTEFNNGNTAFTIEQLVPGVAGTPYTQSPTTDNTPTWKWTSAVDAGSGIKGYHVSIGTTPNGNDVINAQFVTVDSFTHTTGLMAGTYYAQIVAEDNAGNQSAASGVGTVDIINADLFLKSPSALDSSLEGQDSARLTWKAPLSAVSYYKIYRSNRRITKSNKDSAAVVGTSSDTAYDDLSLAKGRTYYYQVAAVDENQQESDLSLNVINDNVKVPSDENATWTSQSDFENNASTVGIATIIGNIDTQGLAGSVTLISTGAFGDGTEGDLVIDGSTYDENNPYVLDGVHNFRNLTIQNGGVLTHTSASGGMDLYIQEKLIVDETSKIEVTGKGYAAQTGPGYSTAGGAGAGYGGEGGGLGSSPVSGVSYGQPDGSDGMQMGSGSYDAVGGGRLKIVASAVDISGDIEANGEGGGIAKQTIPWGAGTNDIASGGASGGGIYIEAPFMNINGIISAAGGGGATLLEDAGASQTKIARYLGKPGSKGFGGYGG
ncbi:hypothetical protein LCGC14_0989970, partial [marine sediment metagenome]